MHISVARQRYQAYLEKKKELNVDEENHWREKRKIKQQLKEIEEKKKIMQLEQEKEDIEIKCKKKILHNMKRCWKVFH
ncbi:hypothetical protein PR048_029783 [Dryococelus australis]|uniref:Uncharacterized protein n=1 Tax=Dryococelus australis TaxID=614101 RepID=A0ABQ9G748_9NEOP|nr:hypothetical protein PR048_029783 [Dryococelus australis]